LGNVVVKAREAARKKHEEKERERKANWLRAETACVKHLHGDVPVETRAALHAQLLEWVLEDTPIDESVKTWRGIRLTFHEFRLFCYKHDLNISRYFDVNSQKVDYGMMRDGSLKNAVHILVDCVIHEFTLAPATGLELFVKIDLEDSIERRETTEVWGRAL